ncbi:MAG: hypothetical protein JSU58_00750 [Dehalococcoidales bacterium]|nr:MAG: hypothetical protein JSU58_00750 [Dehalococcoidales bacterium]
MTGKKGENDMENTSILNSVNSHYNDPLKRTIHDRALYSLIKSLGYAVTGRVHFKHERLGISIKSDDGHDYTIFRQVTVDNKSNNRDYHGITLTIKFSFARGSSNQNKILSLLPIPFITGLPGFRSKIWAVRKDNGDFMGIYEWDTVHDTEKYKQSFAIMLMTKRAIPGSVKFQTVLP